MDELALFIMSYCYFLFFVDIIGYRYFGWLKLAVLSSLMMFLTLLLVVTTGYSEFNMMTVLFFLVSVGSLKRHPKLSFRHLIYFACLTTFVLTLIKLLVSQLIYVLFIALPIPFYFSTFSLIELLSGLVILSLIMLCRKKSSVIVRYLMDSSFYLVSYFIVIVGNFLLMVMATPKLTFLDSLNKKTVGLSTNLVVILFILLVCLLIFYVYMGQEKMRQIVQETNDQELFHYTAELEKNHEVLASFRHDYLNILLTLDEGIRKKDLALLEQVYYDTIQPTFDLINDQALDLIKLSHIQIPSIKSLLSVKITEAQQKQVTVLVDIPNSIGDVSMKLADFTRCLAIIMDNAIFEAAESLDKEVIIAFFQLKGEQKLIVKNTCRQSHIDLQAIYQKNYSNKQGQGTRGYGLSNLKKIVDGYDNISLETSFQPPYFSQLISMKIRPNNKEKV